MSGEIIETLILFQYGCKAQRHEIKEVSQSLGRRKIVASITHSNTGYFVTISKHSINPVVFCFVPWPEEKFYSISVYQIHPLFGGSRGYMYKPELFCWSFMTQRMFIVLVSVSWCLFNPSQPRFALQWSPAFAFSEQNTHYGYNWILLPLPLDHCSLFMLFTTYATVWRSSLSTVSNSTVCSVSSANSMLLFSDFYYLHEVQSRISARIGKYIRHWKLRI